MVILGKQKADSDFLQKLRALFRRDVNFYAQRLQHIGGSAFGGCCPVSVLCHRHSSGRNDQGSGGGDIKGVCAVSAGADNLKYIHIMEQLDTVGAHSGCGCGNFVDVFAFD